MNKWQLRRIAHEMNVQDVIQEALRQTTDRSEYMRALRIIVLLEDKGYVIKKSSKQ